ncbi:hypothetical protein B0H16DRAFT_106512 [Mycena metata]|uniref:Uncharacterized protein n=1 Tax=Mycena metata TaxID=1033252 RepID=A0AAD7I9U7_9AGAR|nr:hypothetical protein B0H16DRAFT_106512 [Mycena metata]
MFPKLSPIDLNTAIHPKDLTVLWNRILPHKRHSAASTLLVDGLARGGAQQPHNLLLLPEYAKPLRRLDLDRFHQLTDTNVSKSQSAAAKDHTRERLRRDANPKTRSTRYELRLAERGVYDDALIAFLGILEYLRPARNVAAWIRGGGLFGVPNSEDAAQYNTTAAPWFHDRAVFEMWLERGRAIADRLQIALEPGVVNELQWKPQRPIRDSLRVRAVAGLKATPSKGFENTLGFQVGSP